MRNLLFLLFAPLLLIHPSISFAKSLTLSSGLNQTTVVELYTSEGCSSCPPAEKWLNRQKHHPDLWKKLIPLAFHVDYWDYIGWKDSFAVPENTQRQTAYRDQGGIRTIYTPEIVKDGKEWRRWYSTKRIPLSTQKVGKLSASITNGIIHASFSPIDPQKKNFILNVALLGFDFETTIKAGENAGRSLKHDFVVIGQASQLSSTKSWQMKVPPATVLSKRQGIALWVSEPNNKTPLQAVGAWLN